MWLEKPLAENLAVLAKKLNMKPSKALSEAIFDWLKKRETFKATRFGGRREKENPYPSCGHIEMKRRSSQRGRAVVAMGSD